MAKRERTKIVYVDPLFYVPPGVEYRSKKEIPGGTEPVDPDFNPDEMDGSVGEPFEPTPTGVDPAPSGKLATPTSFRVVEQVLRVNKNGNTVVDLIVEVGDVKGATDYEFRVTAE